MSNPNSDVNHSKAGQPADANQSKTLTTFRHLPTLNKEAICLKQTSKINFEKITKTFMTRLQ